MDKIALENKHNQIAGSDFVLSCSLEEMRNLSDSALKERQEVVRISYYKIRKENLSWKSIPSIINLISIPAYLLSFGAIIEFFSHREFKSIPIAAIAIISIAYCVFHFYWLKNRRIELSLREKELKAIDAVLIERGDKIATMMQHIEPENL